ncbi:MAG: 3-phosphoshikimate 1-carboxyvinyltransferase [Bacteroidetes bacterium]|nr:3-phosphoshikimate 1-carboxyvinyltransferase [Bacteroidota bacterium]
MIVTVHPCIVEGQLRAPSSKSYMQRAVAAALLAEGTTIITNPSLCDDGLAALDAVETLGAKVGRYKDRIEITGGLDPKRNTVCVGESGLGMRLFSAVCALSDKPVAITGKGSLPKRPLPGIQEALQALGAECSVNGGFLPVKVKGPLKGGRIIVDGALTSQFLTGLLTALPLAPGDSEITVTGLKSLPYIDMTLDVLSDFGISVENLNYESFRIKGRQKYTPCRYEIEGDWSGAAFPVVAGAVAGRVKLSGLKRNSRQADRQILDIVNQAGAEVVWAGSSLYIEKNRLSSFDCDLSDCPDLFPPAVALAAHVKGNTRLRGINRLIHKESDRAEVLKTEFSKLGVNIRLSGDEMIIEGGEVRSGSVSSNNDHRIAMACTVAALAGSGQVSISGTECVSKSWPGFFDDFAKLYNKRDNFPQK